MSDSTLAVGSQIQLGHSMITFIEPHRSEGLHEHNRWYEHDHAYAAMTAAPGCFAYRRYVATRRLKDLRFPADQGARLELAAPFIPTIPGTDAYVDQLR